MAQKSDRFLKQNEKIKIFYKEKKEGGRVTKPKLRFFFNGVLNRKSQ